MIDPTTISPADLILLEKLQVLKKLISKLNEKNNIVQQPPSVSGSAPVSAPASGVISSVTPSMVATFLYSPETIVMGNGPNPSQNIVNSSSINTNSNPNVEETKSQSKTKTPNSATVNSSSSPNLNDHKNKTSLNSLRDSNSIGGDDDIDALTKYTNNLSLSNRSKVNCERNQPFNTSINSVTDASAASNTTISNNNISVSANTNTTSSKTKNENNSPAPYCPASVLTSLEDVENVNFKDKTLLETKSNIAAKITPHNDTQLSHTAGANNLAVVAEKDVTSGNTSLAPIEQLSSASASTSTSTSSLASTSTSSTSDSVSKPDDEPVLFSGNNNNGNGNSDQNNSLKEESKGYSYEKFCQDLNVEDDYILRLLDLLIKETATGSTAPSRQLGTPGFLPTENVDPRVAPQRYNLDDRSIALLTRERDEFIDLNNNNSNNINNNDDDYFLNRSPAIITDYPATFFPSQGNDHGIASSGGNNSHLGYHEDMDLNLLSLDGNNKSSSPSLSSSLSASPVLTYYPDNRIVPTTYFPNSYHSSQSPTAQSQQRSPDNLARVTSGNPIRDTLISSTADLPPHYHSTADPREIPSSMLHYSSGNSNGFPVFNNNSFASEESFHHHNRDQHQHQHQNHHHHHHPSQQSDFSGSSISPAALSLSLNSSSNPHNTSTIQQPSITSSSSTTNVTANPWISSTPFERNLIVSRRGSMWDAYDDPSLEGLVVQEINGVELPSPYD